MGPAGVFALMLVAEFTTTSVAAAPPMVTAAPAAKLLPLI
jgi:hypothetical protein